MPYSIVRPSQYTIIYWYPCSILNIVVKGRHPKQDDGSATTVQIYKISGFTLGIYQSRTSIKAILPHHFYVLQLIETMTDSPNSELSTASLFVNVRPSTWRASPLAIIIKNISEYLHGPVKSLYNGGQRIARSSPYYQRWRWIYFLSS